MAQEKSLVINEMTDIYCDTVDFLNLSNDEFEFEIIKITKLGPDTL